MLQQKYRLLQSLLGESNWMILNLHSPGPKPFKIPTANSHWKRNTLLTSDRRRNPPDQLGQSTSVENLQNSLPSHQNYFFLSFSLFFLVLGVLCIVFLCSHNLAIPASLPGLRSHQLHYLHTFGTASICEWSLGKELPILTWRLHVPSLAAPSPHCARTTEPHPSKLSHQRLRGKLIRKRTETAKMFASETRQRDSERFNAWFNALFHACVPISKWHCTWPRLAGASTALEADWTDRGESKNITMMTLRRSSASERSPFESLLWILWYLCIEVKMMWLWVSDICPLQDVSGNVHTRNVCRLPHVHLRWRYWDHWVYPSITHDSQAKNLLYADH